MTMQTGIMWIKFKENATDDDIQKATSEFYAKNEKIIDGMEFNQLINREALVEAKTAVKKLLS